MRGGWGQFFFFSLTKFLVLAVGPSRETAGLGVGFRWWVWWSVWWGGRGRDLSDASILGRIAWSVLGADSFGWFLSFPGLLSGQSAMSGSWPWIGLGGPGEGLEASVIISLMLCNNIKFQNSR